MVYHRPSFVVCRPKELPMAEVETPTWLDLYDWRRRVARMWREREQAERAGDDPAAVWRRFCAQKDALFRDHPQTPLTAGQREDFGGLVYFPYDPRWRVEARLSLIPPAPAPD